MTAGKKSERLTMSDSHRYSISFSSCPLSAFVGLQCCEELFNQIFTIFVNLSPLPPSFSATPSLVGAHRLSNLCRGWTNLRDYFTTTDRALVSWENPDFLFESCVVKIAKTFNFFPDSYSCWALGRYSGRYFDISRGRWPRCLSII